MCSTFSRTSSWCSRGRHSKSSARCWGNEHHGRTEAAADHGKSDIAQGDLQRGDVCRGPPGEQEAGPGGGREAVQGQGARRQDDARLRQDEDQGADRRKASRLEEGGRGAQTGRQDRVFRRRVTRRQARSLRTWESKNSSRPPPASAPRRCSRTRTSPKRSRSGVSSRRGKTVRAGTTRGESRPGTAGGHTRENTGGSTSGETRRTSP